MGIVHSPQAVAYGAPESSVLHLNATLVAERLVRGSVHQTNWHIIVGVLSGNWVYIGEYGVCVCGGGGGHVIVNFTQGT